jgi:hypothetical protein
LLTLSVLSSPKSVNASLRAVSSTLTVTFLPLLPKVTLTFSPEAVVSTPCKAVSANPNEVIVFWVAETLIFLLLEASTAAFT